MPASLKQKKIQKTDFSVFAALAVVLLFFILSGILSHSNIRLLKLAASNITQTHETIMTLESLFSVIKDAETSQRGYVLTGRDSYLEPYNAATSQVNGVLDRIGKLMQADPQQAALLPEIEAYTKAKIDELAETISLRRTRGFDAAVAVVLTDRGKEKMDLLRDRISQMQRREQEVRRARFAQMEKAHDAAIVSSTIAALVGILLALAITVLVRRGELARRRKEWLQSGQVGLGLAIAGEQKTAQLGQNILKFLAEYVDAQAGAFFIREGTLFRRAATYGVPSNGQTPDFFSLEDGVLGQAARDRKIFRLDDVPESYLTIGSALGQGAPRYLIVAPTQSEDQVNGVIELGFLQNPSENTMALIEEASEAIALAVQAANYRESLQNFLEETQRQSEELQAQGEELRVSNEELEEQSRVLQESQVRLEHQQAELEQTNAQLEEQAQILESQRDDLEKAQESLELRSRDLEQASRYKSDFLANMSHELRTPLNSSLILAKLLADNPNQNLTPEQVRHAQTIQAAGNDLLNLINDILDLSKIEAGHMEVLPERIRVTQLVDNVMRIFEPLAQEKKLEFAADISPTCPEIIETDVKRLEQVLKNLLSNAIKFTEKGAVKLSISCAGGGNISFAVSDTGIGIAADHQQIIFEAFRQADGTTNRKYGGTGLGLSISRELMRLLGGDIALSSEEGRGSVFTAILPVTYDAETVQPRAMPVAMTPVAPIAVPAEESASVEIAKSSSIKDDRHNLNKKQHVILIVEDDESFARILYDMAHELNFQCLVSGTADEALQVVRRYQPSAVILDIGLPDHSGLSVLDRLKQNPQTRHIPVHIVSANDCMQTALSMGAIGYMLKPVRREALTEALKQLEHKMVQRLRRILIVEDDKVQRESLQALLEAPGVEISGVGTAAACLELLKANTFDCMVLDLSLPDTTGYALLETLSLETNDYSFPPVIVYTGKDLSLAEEQALRRYSRSIIVKGAKSPERLMDEVTLFLHQVVADLPAKHQSMLRQAQNRDAVLEGRRILVVEDDIRNVYSLTNILEPRGAVVKIARNGREALDALEAAKADKTMAIDLVLMDVMMPEMDGIAATREIRKDRAWRNLPIIMLTAKAMRDDQQRCLDAGANDYMAKPLDVEKLLSLVRVWMPR